MLINPGRIQRGPRHFTVVPRSAQGNIRAQTSFTSIKLFPSLEVFLSWSHSSSLHLKCWKSTYCLKLLYTVLHDRYHTRSHNPSLHRHNMVHTPSPATAAFALLTLGALGTVNAAAIPAFRGLSGYAVFFGTHVSTTRSLVQSLLLCSTPAASTGAPLTSGIGLAHSSPHMNASESEHHHGYVTHPLLHA